MGMNFEELNLAIFHKTAGKKVLFQPRINSWYDDKIFANHPRFEILVQLIISLRTSKFLNENRHLYSIELYLSKNVANDWISNIHEINSDYYSPYILDSVKYLIEHHMKYENPIDLYQKNPNHFLPIIWLKQDFHVQYVLTS